MHRNMLQSLQTISGKSYVYLAQILRITVPTGGVVVIYLSLSLLNKNIDTATQMVASYKKSESNG